MDYLFYTLDLPAYIWNIWMVFKLCYWPD